MAERSLITISFRGASLAALAGPTPETTLVAVKPLVDGMGLPWEAQRQRILRHPVLRTCTCVMQVQLPGDTQSRETVFLELTRVHFFLGTIQPERIKDKAARDAVIAFQSEAADVLFGHFFGKAAKAVSDAAEHAAPAPMVPAPLTNLSLEQLMMLPVDERKERRLLVAETRETLGTITASAMFQRIICRSGELVAVSDAPRGSTEDMLARLALGDDDKVEVH